MGLYIERVRRTMNKTKTVPDQKNIHLDLRNVLHSTNATVRGQVQEPTGEGF